VQKMLRSVKNHACAWLCGILYLVPALRSVGLPKRELILYHEAAVYIGIALLAVVLSVIAFTNYKNMNLWERFFAGLAPTVAMLHAFLMLPGMKEWIGAVCGLVGCIAALAVFVRCSSGAPLRGILGIVCGIVMIFSGWVGAAVVIGLGCIALVLMKEGRLKAFLGAVYGAAGTFTVLILLAGILFAVTDFGAEYSSEALDSPDGRYTARLVFVDEGALGSSQYVLVEEKGAGINVLIGRLQKSERIFLDELNYVYDWDNESFVPFEWADEHTLTVDGRRVEVKR